RSVIMVSRKGMVKKTELIAFSHPRSNGIIAMNVAPEDHLMGVQLTSGQGTVLLGTRKGKAIRFKEAMVRDMGRLAAGVIGIRMDKDDELVGMEMAHEGSSIISVTEHGYGKQTTLDEYPLHGRGGKGTINLKTVPKVGNVAGIIHAEAGADVILLSITGKMIRLKVEEIPTLHRSTQGVRLIDLDPEEKVAGIARAEREIETEASQEEASFPEELELADAEDES
ncbi:MAG: DNA gyrase C-terminal beta-propeller domain-containing protein, partial [Smithellaceae bacterium]|nr:DNA gyrase C-terminal beta-propeller domain-containing protein [Smithellaceae bacterium]